MSFCPRVLPSCNPRKALAALERGSSQPPIRRDGRSGGGGGDGARLRRILPPLCLRRVRSRLPTLACRSSLCSRRVILRLFSLRRGRCPRRRRLRLLVGRGRSHSPPGRPPSLPLLSPRLGGRSVRRRARLRRVCLLGLSSRPRSLVLALGLLLRLRFRAEGILAGHVAAPRAGVIRVRVRSGELVGYLVRGSGGAVYRVEAKGSWRCSCPDHHGRHRRRAEGSRACKHALACWALWRAASEANSPGVAAGETESECGEASGEAEAA